MKKPIRINLTKLTDANVRTALKKQDVCEYKAPCVVGTLMKPAERITADEGYDEDASIATLVDFGVVDLPAEQRGLVISLQENFDGLSVSCGPRDFTDVLRKVAKLPGSKLTKEGIDQIEAKLDEEYE